MRAGLIALIILVVIVLGALVVGGGLISSRNSLVAERESIDALWSQVDTDLQRRADLIPNLVATVKGFATHEQQVIDSVTSARAALGGAKTPADKIAANDQLSSALNRLLVVVENYPQLKSDQNFLSLQDQLEGTENRINISRRRYNEAVQKYNTDIQQFPQNIAASMFGFHRDDAYFKADTSAKEAPKVAF